MNQHMLDRLAEKMILEAFDGYKISDLGEIFDADGAPVKQFFNGKYLCVYLGRGSNRKRYYVHRLVAETFLVKPDGASKVVHLDGNRTNNSVSNLFWCTHAEAMRFTSGLNEKYILDLTTGKEYSSYGEAARDIGGSRHGVYFTSIGIQSSHKGHKFVFKR